MRIRDVWWWKHLVGLLETFVFSVGNVCLYMGNCINDEGMICIFWGSKRYFFLSKGRCCLMSSTIVAALLVESFNSDELKFNLFPLRFLLFFLRGRTSLQHLLNC